MRIVNILLLIVLLLAMVSCEIIAGKEGDMIEVEPMVHGSDFPLDQIIEGTPSPSMYVLNEGYIVWKQGDMFNVRIVKDRIPREYGDQVYSGSVIVADALVHNVIETQTDPFDRVFAKEDEIDFEFRLHPTETTTGKGFSFRVRPIMPEYCIILDLRLNGAALPGLIHLGRSFFEPQEVMPRICFREF